MTIGRLKFLRLVIPGVIIALYASLFLYLYSGYVFEIPDFSKAPYLPLIMVPAALYYASPFRTRVNAASHQRITENLRKGMIRIAGQPDNEIYTWKRIRPIFFSLVDNDKSLSAKSSLAYFNGLMWTSFADSAAVAAGFCLVSVVFCFFGVQNCWVLFIVFGAIAIISFVARNSCEKIHISIGDQQLEIIEESHKADVAKRISRID